MKDLLSSVITPTGEELVTIQFLYKLQKALGYPPNLDSAAGLKLMDALIGVWQKHFPQEVADWTHDRQVDLAFEKPLKSLNQDAVGLYNPVSYPRKLFELIKVMFPDIKLQQKKTFMKLIQIYPNLFKTSNYL